MKFAEAGLDLAVVMISGEGDIPDAVSAMKLGAYDYLRKPIDPAHLKTLLISNIVDHLSVREENDRLRRRLLGEGELGPMIGHSLAMRRVLTLIDQVAPTDASAIVTRGKRAPWQRAGGEDDPMSCPSAARVPISR